ncbi:MAG: T9SS type A sorting domain-containing protein [Cyclobacteriaceae bacterium]
MNKALTKSMAAFFFVIFICNGLSAQETENQGKITLEITKEINGEKKTFKGEYENEEQMRADPNYQEFVGEEQSFSFNFDGFDQDMSLNIQELLNQNGFSFHFDSDATNSFHMFSDTMMMGLNNLGDMTDHIEALKEHMKAFQLDESDVAGWIFSDPGSEDFRNHIQRLQDRNYDTDVLIIKKLKIEEVEGDEFGKKGKVKDSEALKLETLDYFPNPSHGKFKLRFKVPQQGELSVKVFDLNGKEIFNRYFSQFGGLYSESIDLTDQNEGIYLLEIKLDKERLTRKIVIE